MNDKLRQLVATEIGNLALGVMEATVRADQNAAALHEAEEEIGRLHDEIKRVAARPFPATDGSGRPIDPHNPDLRPGVTVFVSHEDEYKQACDAPAGGV